MPNNNYVESLIELDIKLADIEARERDNVAQSVELKNDIQATLFLLSDCAQSIETEMTKRLRKNCFIATQIGQSPFGSRIDTFLSELRILLNSPAPARNQLTVATEAVCSWFQVGLYTHLSLKSNNILFHFSYRNIKWKIETMPIC